MFSNRKNINFDFTVFACLIKPSVERIITNIHFIRDLWYRLAIRRKSQSNALKHHFNPFTVEPQSRIELYKSQSRWVRSLSHLEPYKKPQHPFLEALLWIWPMPTLNVRLYLLSFLFTQYTQNNCYGAIHDSSWQDKYQTEDHHHKRVHEEI